MYRPARVDELLYLYRTATLMAGGYFVLLAIIDRWVIVQHPLDSLYYLTYGGGAFLLLLLAYLPRLPNRFRPAHAGLAIVIMAVLPILFEFILGTDPPWLAWRTATPQISFVRHLPVLLLPVLLVSWLYDWRYVGALCLGIALVNLAMLAVQLPAAEPAAIVVVFIVLRSLVYFGAGYLIGRLAMRLRQQQASLTAANARLADLASTQEHLATSRERNRVARELHDTLAHTLSALTLQLETLKAYWDVEPVAARQLLDEALVMVRHGLEDTRAALTSLRTNPVADLGLLLALRQLAESAAERANLCLDLHLPGEALELSERVEQCLYRVAQEATTNVVYHAGARHLTLRLENLDDHVRLIVMDDGRGFDAAQPARPGHFGLRGLREWAQLAGGQLQICSRPGAGASIELQLPKTR